ncbi:hypothetical protein DEO72_LG6g1062 [Vigna unguiculata]|uniref:Uncharacterized protein n=1 Tax=Vigna unguiculata TaxID=3917 RepID=A0A4D6M6Q3_VIGUN|nr:hypothetical protein DEO72_LG6g1062 [Vigna unguiculata]
MGMRLYLAPRAVVLAIVPPRLLLTLLLGEFRARTSNLAQASRTRLSESGGGEVSSPKRASAFASASVIEFSPRRRGTRLSESPSRLSESPSRLSETPWPERRVLARNMKGIGLKVRNSLESLGETFRVALQWSGRNSMTPVSGCPWWCPICITRGEQRYPPQVQASAESDQVIRIRMSRVVS